jgi:alpha-1,6-mannosyltransferase
MLNRRHVLAIVLVTLAFAVKATAAVVLPFLVWIWVTRLEGTQRARMTRAIGSSVAIFVGVFASCSLAAGVGLGWIPALRTSSTIINWLSLPSAVGDIVHTVVNWFVRVDQGIFMGVARALGSIILLRIAWKQWRAASIGGTEAVRRSAITMLAVALLSPATLPWYFSWPLVLGAGLAWSASGLVVMALASVFLLLVTFPDGDTALYSWGYLFIALLVSLLAAVTVVRPDPLGLSSRYDK